MDKFWDRIDATLQRYAPELFKWMKPGATIEQIAAAETAIGLPFSPELRAAYLRHNGCYQEGVGSTAPDSLTDVFVCVDDWCSLDALVESWRRHLASREQVLKDWPDAFDSIDPNWTGYAVKERIWNAKGIPIGLSNTMNTLYVDLDPGFDGHVGQLIFDMGMGEPSLVAPSVNAYFTQLATLLESGALVHDARYGWVEATRRFQIRRIWPKLDAQDHRPAPLLNTYTSLWTPNDVGQIQPTARPWLNWHADADNTQWTTDSGPRSAAELPAAWDRIDAVLERFAPKFFATLRPPASEGWLAVIEAEVKRPLPADFCAAYLRHDGNGTGGKPATAGVQLHAFLPTGFWCGMSELLRECGRAASQQADERAFSKLKDPPPPRYGPPVRSEAASKQWLAIGACGFDIKVFMDTRASGTQPSGQLIDHVVTGTPNAVAPSLTAHFLKLCDLLEGEAVQHLPLEGWIDPSSQRHVLAIYPELVLGDKLPVGTRLKRWWQARSSPR
jgi:cell wall assembly regulator SMI1